MKIWFLLFLLLTGFGAPAFAATELSFAGPVKAELAWEKGPRSPAESVLLVTWKDAEGRVVNAPAAFKVVLFMPDMGHGSAPTYVEPARTTEGAYRVSRVYFTMGGRWEVRVVLGSETRSVALEIAESEAHHHAGLGTFAPIASAASLNEEVPSLASSPAFAAICADSVTAHPRLKGFWHLDRPHFALTDSSLYATMEPRPNEKGAYAVVKVDRANPAEFVEIARFQKRVRDLAYHDGKVWALFADKVVALDGETGAELLSLATTTIPSANEEENAQAFAWAGSRLVVAHGTRGMVAYDEKAAGFTMAHALNLSEGGRLSKAISVTAVNENQVAFAVENVSVSNSAPYPFEGIVLFNFAGGAAVERYPYDRKLSGSIAEARLLATNGELFINNWGILHQVKIDEMRAKGTVIVHWTPLRFPINGLRMPGELLGDLLTDGTRLFACGHTQYQDSSTHAVIHQGMVFEKNLSDLLRRL